MINEIINKSPSKGGYRYREKKDKLLSRSPCSNSLQLETAIENADDKAYEVEVVKLRKVELANQSYFPSLLIDNILQNDHGLALHTHLPQHANEDRHHELQIQDLFKKSIVQSYYQNKGITVLSISVAKASQAEYQNHRFGWSNSFKVQTVARQFIKMDRINCTNFPRENYDIICTTGLFERISQETAQRFTNKLFAHLNQNGRQLIGARLEAPTKKQNRLGGSNRSISILEINDFDRLICCYQLSNKTFTMTTDRKFGVLELQKRTDEKTMVKVTNQYA